MIPKDTMEYEDYLRWEKGLPPRPKPAPPVYVEPEPPVVENQIKLSDIPEGEILDFDARSVRHKNKTGVIFIGFNFYVKFEGGKTVSGFLFEGDFYQLKARIPKERIDLLRKIVN